MSSPQVQAAIISAIVALLTATLSGYFTWSQIQRERIKWRTDLKATFNVELFKARLATYPQVVEVIRGLSSGAPEQLTRERAIQIFTDINTWLYSAGGLCAEATTRGALVGLRNSCRSWGGGQDDEWNRLFQFRAGAVMLLRRDLDLRGLEAYDLEDTRSLLQMVEAELASLSTPLHS